MVECNISKNNFDHHKTLEDPVITLKICLVNSYYPPWIGGAETYVSNVARGLQRIGHEVTVYCADRPLKSGESLEDGIRVIRMRTPLRFYGTPITVIPKAFLGENYDVIHSNFPGPYLASISAWVARAKETRSVLTWHNDLPPVTSSAGVAVKLHDRVSSMYLDFYDRIVATTGVYAKASKTLRHYSNKVVVIRNGVDTSRFNPNVKGDAIRERFHLGNSKVAIFVGALTTFHTYKGVDILLKAFKKACETSDVKLLVVGEGDLSSGYMKAAQEIGISARVIFTGRAKDSELPEYFAASDFAVLPSKDSSEGFGLALLEAMATGKAVIGSRVGGIPEIVRDGVNGILVEPNNIDQLAKAMILLAGDDEIRSKMGEAGLSFARSNDWSVVARKLIDLYKAIS